MPLDPDSDTDFDFDLQELRNAGHTHLAKPAKNRSDEKLRSDEAGRLSVTG
jgi:hypothetical protein